MTYLKEDTLFFFFFFKLIEQGLLSIYSSRMTYTVLEGGKGAAFGANHTLSLPSLPVISLESTASAHQGLT